jgi:hypothetical protein
MTLSAPALARFAAPTSEEQRVLRIAKPFILFNSGLGARVL